MDEKGLTCSIKASYPAFKLDVNFSVKKGSLSCIIGPSGCGKTTTLQLISGLIQPDEGFISLNGTDITQTAVNQRQIALVFQDYALFPQMNVQQNITYPMKLRKVPRSQMVERATMLLDLVSLPGYQKRRSSQLSGGERQRVALARALASEPELMLLDEPLSALDSQLRKHLRDEIRSLHDKTGVTMLYVTHDQGEAMAIADSIIVMNEGKIEQIGSPEEIYNQPQSLFVATFMGESNILPYDVIEQVLVSEGNDYVIFSPKDGEQTIFFRPELVTIQDDMSLPFPDYLPHLEFRNSSLLSCTFQGSFYYIVYRWQNYEIHATAQKRPKGPEATLGVRLTNILQFLDGKRIG